MNTISTSINRQSLKAPAHMRSSRGFWGVIVLIAMIPLALLYPLVFDYGFSTFLHWMLAAGSLLISLAVFDFDKLPKWLTWVGFLSVGGAGTIFFLQGLSDLLQNESLAYVAYQLLGQELESWLPRLFIVVWCGGLLLLDSQGKTRVFGFIAISAYIAVEVYRLSMMYLGVSPNDMLKLTIFLPLVWLLFESKKAMQKA